MAQLPSGTVTFLFTDIEGSTARWEHQPEAMRAALARHDAILRAAIVGHGGHVVKTMGDAFHAVFTRAPDAVAAALDAQRRLQAESWGEIRPLHVRMALHTGAAEERDGDYYGPPLNRAARLMSAGHGGQMLLSEVAAGLVKDTLPDGVDLLDLGRHRLKDLSEPEHVFQVVAPDLPSDFPALTSLDARPNNLPTHPTALLGRERELAEVRKLFEDGARLLTLTGPGGTGKTRLSLQVAAEMLDDFADGAFLVELAPISDPGLVPSTIAQVLGLRDIGGRPVLEILKENLRSRSTLLVLDNFEQLLPAAPVVADLLASGPSLRMLVTSREPLRLRGEHEYAVPPLALPDARDPATPGSLVQYAAVALFLERAVAIRSDFTVTHENAPAVGEICARLDGLPLAIELAAARVRLLTPQAIAGRLERRLPLLTGGARDLPTRQQTLRDTIAWSQDLLDDPERRLFRRLSVFVGGWTLEAAEAVCGLNERDVDVLAGMESLVSKSLARGGADSSGETRFGMLETIREYGLEQLQTSGELGLLRRRHAAYYVDRAVEAGPNLLGPEQVRWLDSLEREVGNLHAALRWTIERQDAELGMRLVASLSWFWYLRGHYGEGRALRAAVLALPTGPELAALRAELLQGGGMLAIHQGDYPAARALLEEGLAIARTLNDRRLLALTLITLGWVTRVQDDYATARPALEEGLAVARAAGDAFHTAMALHHLGLLDLEADRAVDVAWSRNEDSLTFFRQIGNRRMAGVVLMGMCRVDRLRGHAARARMLIVEAMHAFGEVGDVGQVPQTLHILASLEADDGQLARAVRLAAAAAKLGEVLGSRPWPVTLRERDAWLGPARGALGDEAFARAWAEGQAMTREQAVADALERSAQA